MPWLRSELEAHEPWLKVRLRKLAYRLPARLKNRALAKRLQPPNNPSLIVRHQRAAIAVLILGSRAGPLAGNLANLLNSGEDCSLYSLALVRTDSIGSVPLTKAVTNQAHWSVIESILPTVRPNTSADVDPRRIDLVRVDSSGNWTTLSGTAEWPASLKLDGPYTRRP